MTSGHGGCGPYGLALSAYRRGFDLEIHVNEDGVFLVDSVRSLEKKEVMRLVQEDWIEELRHLPVLLHRGSLGRGRTAAEVRGRRHPAGADQFLSHLWRTISALGGRHRLRRPLHLRSRSPGRHRGQGETVADSINMPIPHREFQRMARYGKAGQKPC